MFNICFVQSIIISMFTIPFMFIIRDAPEKPASALSKSKVPLSFTEEAKVVLSNSNYKFLMGAFSLLFGTY